MGAVEEETAGDVLRAAIADGEEKRALAARLAGTRADKAAIERWRGVITRALRGSEPKPDQATRIAKVFGKTFSQSSATTTRGRRQALEVEVGKHREVLQKMLVVVGDLSTAIEGLGGKPPTAVIDELALEVRQLRPGGRPK